MNQKSKQNSKQNSNQDMNQNASQYLKKNWRSTSVRSVIAILGLVLAVACATEPLHQTNRPERKSYLDQINTPLTESWNTEVRSQIGRLKSATANVQAEKMTATVLGAVSPDGKVQTVRLIKSSGVKIIDDLAVEAFKQASPLPPPPPYVIRKGFANVHWDFNLKK